MENKKRKSGDSYFDIDRMINEGLGGGFINSKYAEKQMELMEEKTSTAETTSSEMKDTL